jgi:hypothetical protein
MKITIGFPIQNIRLLKKHDFFTDASTKMSLSPWNFYRFSKFRMFWKGMMTCHPYMINRHHSRRARSPGTVTFETTAVFFSCPRVVICNKFWWAGRGFQWALTGKDSKNERISIAIRSFMFWPIGKNRLQKKKLDRNNMLQFGSIFGRKSSKTMKFWWALGDLAL